MCVAKDVFFEGVFWYKQKPLGMAVATKHAVLATKALPHAILCTVIEYTISVRDLLLYLPQGPKMNYNEKTHAYVLYENTTTYGLNHKKAISVFCDSNFSTIFVLCTDTLCGNDKYNQRGPGGAWHNLRIHDFDDPVEAILAICHKPCAYFVDKTNEARGVTAKLLKECMFHLLTRRDDA